MRKTSAVHRDSGKHQHKVMIFDSYEVYTVCKKCGMHDWSHNADDLGGVDDYKKKYPQHEVIDINGDRAS